MSTLEVGQDNLSTVDYQDKLEAISHALQGAKKLFDIYENRITFDIDLIANQIAKQFATSNAYSFENKNGTTYASIHMRTIDAKRAFSEQLEQLIIQQLRSALLRDFQASVKQPSLEKYLSELFKPLGSFSTPTFSKKTTTGLKYALDKQIQFEKQRLHLQPQQKENTPWLKGHKVTIEVGEIKHFDQQIIEGICTYLQQQQVEAEEIEETKDILQSMAEKHDSPFAQLRRAVIEESLARIQRTARTFYLRYLHEEMRNRKVKDREKVQGINLLASLIRRLHSIEQYIQQEDYGHYQVTYKDTKLNLCDLFSRADAFDALPLISEIEGSLGESTDYLQGSKTFVNGLKLKLNGSVHIHGGNGQPVFQYNLALLDPESKTYQEREAETELKDNFHARVLKVALLYYFVFMKMDDPKYDPRPDFERDILEVFRHGSELEKVNALRKLKQQIEKGDTQLQTLKKALIEFLDLPTTDPKPQRTTFVLSLKDDVLVKDPDSMITQQIFFQDRVQTNDRKDVLKYIAIEKAQASTDAICKLPLHLTFEPIYYYEASEARETFTMTYDTNGIQVLPVFLAPYDTGIVDKYKDVFQENRRIVFPYRHRPDVHSNSAQAFVYRFTYQLLAYIFIKLVADIAEIQEKRKLFFPIVRLHSQEKTADDPGTKYDDETFMYSLSKVLAHLLSQDYISNSQGFHLNTLQGHGSDFYKLDNALYSLYSAIPRLFQLTQPSQGSTSIPGTIAPQHQLEKLAVIVVSSRKCDVNKKTPDLYQATVYGEVIGMERLKDGRVRVGTFSTFSVNQPSQLIYEQPAALIEQVKACYAQGYRHFLYVARAPYSRSLHISDRANSEDLFFMRKDIIQALRKSGTGIKVYPIFCDTYYVVNQRRKSRKSQLTVDSLYIDDLGELASLALDSSRRSLIFLNLFSGATINQQQIYNGVMSYSTLVNVYDSDPTYDQYIWSDVLSEHTPQSFKGELIDFITLLHFSRYEKPHHSGFKLDPYKRIIGDKSVGKMAIFPHMKSSTSFNALAFLTLVRAVLHKDL